jgi:hypothetical protein
MHKVLSTNASTGESLANFSEEFAIVNDSAQAQDRFRAAFRSKEISKNVPGIHFIVPLDRVPI